MTIELPLPDASDTTRLGTALARRTPRSAPQALIVYLMGTLGAGKTTLARGLLRALGVSGTVRSPSYTLLEIYELGERRVLHLDLFRLNGPEELEALGVRDELAPGAMLLIEWPERGTTALAAADVQVQLSTVGEGRSARIEGVSTVGQAWIAAMRGATIPESNRI